MYKARFLGVVSLCSNLPHISTYKLVSLPDSNQVDSELRAVAGLATSVIVSSKVAVNQDQPIARKSARMLYSWYVQNRFYEDSL